MGIWKEEGIEMRVERKSAAKDSDSPWRPFEDPEEADFRSIGTKG